MGRFLSLTEFIAPWNNNETVQESNETLPLVSDGFPQISQSSAKLYIHFFHS